MARTDLQPLTLDKLSWTLEDAPDSLNVLILNVRNRAQDAINWYIHAKNIKRNGATITRIGTIFATTLTVLFTAFAGFPKSIDLGLEGIGIQPLALAAIAAAIATALQGLDRFFGFSKAWMRYISTELKIRNTLSTFNLSWPSRISKWDNGSPDDEQIQEAISACVAFISDVDAAVRLETDQWIADFQTNLKSLEDATKAAATAAKAASDAETQRLLQQKADIKAKKDAERPGSLNVTVTNGSEFMNGWKISIGGSSKSQNCFGKTAAVANIEPGNVSIILEGDLNGKIKRAEQMINIFAGTIASCEVTLE